MVAPTSFDFTGKVALVTGGGTGMGQAAAVALAAAGAKVAITGRSNADATLEMIKQVGGEGIFIRGDVGIEDDVQRIIEGVVGTFGRLDIAFNNAGVGVVGKPLTEQSAQDYDFTMNTDLKGVFFCMKYEIPEMLKVDGGAIINNGSVASIVADPGMSLYVAAKHGVAGITKAAALEYAAQGVRINCLAPSFFATPLTQNWLDDPEMTEVVKGFNAMHKVAVPDEIAGIVLLLASPELASFITGAVIPVDGGQSAH
ncbi:MAG: SDR family oxidoreductase [Bifidobacteriaceae bacterium]|nr:SDR family oxidoreductase [Bifidobacteriaceae bacterium]